jgi:hypothetical protein
MAVAGCRAAYQLLNKQLEITRNRKIYWPVKVAGEIKPPACSAQGLALWCSPLLLRTLKKAGYLHIAGQQLARVSRCCSE